MANYDIDKITYGGNTYNIKDAKAYRLGETVRNRNTSISQDPVYVSLIPNKKTLECQTLIRAVGGAGDAFYSAYKNPNLSVECTYEGINNIHMSTLFSPSASSTILVPITDLSTNPFVITITKDTNIGATDVMHLALFEHTLGNTAARLTDYKVELLTTGSTASSGTYTWQTVYERSNVSDKINGLTIALNPTSYSYLYFKGVRFTVTGATPVSTGSSFWGYNCFDLSLFQLISTRPDYTSARAIGALDIDGGEVYGQTTFYQGVKGNLMGNAATASKLGTSTIGSLRRGIYLDNGVPTEGFNSVTHYGNVDTNNMNDVGRKFASVGAVNLAANTTDNPSNGSTGSSGWHLFFDASAVDNPAESNSWVAQIANKAGTDQWWVRSRNGGTITDGTAWAAPWRHLVTSAQAGAGNSKTPTYVNENGEVVALGYTIEKSVPSDAVFTDTTYESKPAESGGTAVSLVTTGEKYTWNTNMLPSVTSSDDGKELRVVNGAWTAASLPSAVKYMYDESTSSTAGVLVRGFVAQISCVSGNWYNSGANTPIRFGSASGSEWVVPAAARPIDQVEILDSYGTRRIYVRTDGTVCCATAITGVALRFTGVWILAT